jgi:uncharacterized repeat protein (TIGR01451 family)
MIQFRCLLLWGVGLLATLLQPAVAGTNTLTRVGPYGGTINKVAFHPTNPAIAYAATNGGLYRSTTGGTSWQLVSDEFQVPVTDITVSASQPDRLFVFARGAGIWSSTDAGVTLTRLGTSSSFDGNAYEIEYSANGTLLYAAVGSSLYRSVNHGASWTDDASLPVTAGYPPHSLIVDPSDAHRLYVLGAEREAFRSTDAGVLWHSVPLPANSRVFQLAISNAGPGRIWAATSTGAWFTEDDGATWTRALERYALTVSVDPADPTHVYVGTTAGLHRSFDNGTGWSNIQGDAVVGMITSLAIDPTGADRRVLGGQGGVAATNDDGAHWTAGNQGIEALDIHELVSSANSDRIYVNAIFDGLYAIDAEDGGVSALANQQLRQLTSQPGVEAFGLLVVPAATDRLFIGARTGVARSLDAGGSWSLYAFSPTDQARSVVNASADGSRLLAATLGNRVFSSADSGATWTQAPALDAVDLSRMVTAPSNPQVIYLGARRPVSYQDVVMRSPDGGNTWATHDFPGDRVLAIAVDPRNDQWLYAGSSESLFKSTDGGQTWTELSFAPRNLPVEAIAIDPQNPDIVYAARTGRLGRSVDAGATWQFLVTDYVRFPQFKALAIDPLRPYKLYAGIDSGGVREFSVQPDLKISATVPDAFSPYGVPTTLSYRIRNAGPFDATRARATIQLPATATNVTATSPDATCNVAGSIVTCVVPILRTEGSADITIAVTQPAAGDFAVVGTVEADQPDAATADNTVSSDVSIVEVTDLSVSLGAPARVTRGEAINLTLTVRNNGPNEAGAATISLELASGLNVASVTQSAGSCTANGNDVTCHLPGLASLASMTITIVSTATSTTGALAQIAVVNASGVDLLASNNSASAVTTVAEAPQSGGGGGGGGGGGSTSPFMLAALLLLSCLRAAANKFERSARRTLF